MNIGKALLAPPLQSKPVAMQVAQYAAQGPEHFQELMDCFLSADPLLAQRAAWSVGFVTDLNPSLITPFVGTLVAQLSRTDVHQAVVRNSARILAEQEIPEEYHGQLLNRSFELVASNQAPIAVKAYALTILHHLSTSYPDIVPELEMIIRDRMEFETAAFRSRGKRILKSIAKSGSR
ncbi:hypothetical protein CLV98_102186 [Dyadobacter jejuensis]|uniref:HEAT repeat protein n=1 Tax=Dyadobacter jejuensis TaxID=1082580 RepID=A0A316ANT7_9BACT|nr:hypothetical protein [Dyadobacter jejuensis]PWJ59353.1 hypothetical protein CLV98_102186 [Dyadobacter jejuensis]